MAFFRFIFQIWFFPSNIPILFYYLQMCVNQYIYMQWLHTVRKEKKTKWVNVPLQLVGKQQNFLLY